MAPRKAAKKKIPVWLWAALGIGIYYVWKHYLSGSGQSATPTLSYIPGTVWQGPSSSGGGTATAPGQGTSGTSPGSGAGTPGTTSPNVTIASTAPAGAGGVDPATAAQIAQGLPSWVYNVQTLPSGQQTGSIVPIVSNPGGGYTAVTPAKPPAAA